jgi:O-acetyl-ADP-ribose deacetylase (regulator of RNase III)
MIEILKGNIFDSNSDILVNTVNCEGFMGRGIALDFKYRFPSMFKKYVQACHNGKIKIGRLWLYTESNPMILCFPTKNLFRFPTKIEYIEEGLKFFIEHHQSLVGKYGIKSISFPLLGAQSGKLDIEKSKKIMISYLKKAKDIKIKIFEFDDTATDKKLLEIKKKLKDLNLEELKKELKLKGIRKITLDRVHQCINSDQIVNFPQIHNYEFSDTILKSIYSYSKELKIIKKSQSKQISMDF